MLAKWIGTLILLVPFAHPRPVRLHDACSSWRKLAAFFSNCSTIIGISPLCAVSAASNPSSETPKRFYFSTLVASSAKICPIGRAKNML